MVRILRNRPQPIGGRIKINVMFVSALRADAERLRDGFVRNGVRVELKGVASDKSSAGHYAKIYFFTNDEAHRQLAKKIAAEISSVGTFSAEFRDLTETNLPTLSIWLVQQPTTKPPTPAKPPKPAVQVKPPKPALQTKRPRSFATTLVQCPNCPSSVRSDRLEKHLRMHRARNGGLSYVTVRVKKLRMRSTGERFPLEPLGRNIPADQWPDYINRGRGTSVRQFRCKQCRENRSIYADGICYECQIR